MSIINQNKTAIMNPLDILIGLGVGLIGILLFKIGDENKERIKKNKKLKKKIKTKER